MLKSFFKIIFSASFRQQWMKRYEKYGAVRKSLIILLLTALTAGSIGCALWSISLYSENVVMGLVTSIIFIALAVVDFELSVLFSTMAFRFAKNGTVAPMNFKNKQPNNSETQNTSDKTNQTTEDTPVQTKSTKGLDYAIGFLGLIYGIGVIVALVLIVYNAIKP